MVAVPDVVGMSEDDAQKTIRDAGLATAKPNYQAYKARMPGHVPSEQPAAGTVVPKGSFVYIAVRCPSC